MTKHDHMPVALIILDGWGFSNSVLGKAITTAHKPVYDQMAADFPFTRLIGAANPESGHLSLGTGRFVRSDAERIRSAVETGKLEKSDVLKKSFARLSRTGASLHVIAMLSETDEECSTETLLALVETAKRRKIKSIELHCVLDGKASAPGSAIELLARLRKSIESIGIGRIASVCGRFYAMDTSANWERTVRAFTMLVHGDGNAVMDAESAVRNANTRGISEEFLAPMIVAGEGASRRQMVKDGDTLIFANHRPEGFRQLASSVCSAGRDIEVLTLTDYSLGIQAGVIVPKEEQPNVLTQMAAEAGISTCRVTESERTAHLTYLFDGGLYRFNAGDREFHITSINPAKYESRPEAGSFRIADCVRRELRAHPALFIVNLPAADLVSRSLNFEKTVEAVQFVDTCLGGIIDSVLEVGGTAIVTSSHSNSESDGKENLLPFHLVSPANKGLALRESGSLADVAPTILGVLGIDRPNEMTGEDLRIL
jgi:2,3-bisphosphoglycerate-independent phosphoglycerate mutase